MRARFFRIVSEDELMDRVYNIMKDTGALVTLESDLRQLLYLSNLVERERAEKQKREALQRQTNTRR